VVPADGPSLIIAADRIIDAENVGSLIRIAAAFGADGVILGAGTTDPFARRVLRVSMGNVLFLPVAEVDCLASTLTDLSQNHGYQTIATVLDATAEDLTQSVMSERVVLVFGNESHGLDPQVAACCNQRMTIPMWNGTDSLNIAIAAGIFAHCYRTAHSGR
jgi:tRNA G18 (ribose-2'-O)-methylase SpoU